MRKNNLSRSNNKIVYKYNEKKKTKFIYKSFLDSKYFQIGYIDGYVYDLQHGKTFAIYIVIEKTFSRITQHNLSEIKIISEKEYLEKVYGINDNNE